MTPLLTVLFILILLGGVLWGAPSPVARGTPSGNAMTDGFPVKIACGANPTISFWEKQVMPFGYDGGDPIPTSTMFNVLFHTMSPRVLIKCTEISGTATYEPAILTQIQAQINKNQEWTVSFPAGQTWTVYAWLQSFTPDTCEEGKQPEAKFKINVSNTDGNGAEQGPVLVSGGGT